MYTVCCHSGEYHVKNKPKNQQAAVNFSCFIETLGFWNRNQNALLAVSRGSLQVHVIPMCRECSWKNSAPVIFQWYQINRSRFPPSGLHSSRFKHMCSCFLSFFVPVLGFLTWLIESVGLGAWSWLNFVEQRWIKQTADDPWSIVICTALKAICMHK